MVILCSVLCSGVSFLVGFGHMLHLKSGTRGCTAVNLVL